MGVIAISSLLAACSAGTPSATDVTPTPTPTPTRTNARAPRTPTPKATTVAQRTNTPRPTPTPTPTHTKAAPRPVSTAACDSDRRTLEVASEAYYAQNGIYGNEYELKKKGFIREYSPNYDVTVGATQAEANASTNAERSSRTGAARAIKSVSSCP